MGVGINGNIIVDRRTNNFSLEKIGGFHKDSVKEKNHVLYVARKKLQSANFPERYTYATH